LYLFLVYRAKLNLLKTKILPSIFIYKYKRFQRKFYDWLKRPILKIGEDKPLRLPGTGYQPLITYHSITIRNDGQTAAKIV
jgi:hypothetical protein